MIDIVNGVAGLWWGWMGPMLWQVSLLIVIIGVIDRLIHRWAWPEIRHALWLLVLVKLVIPPSWSVSAALFPRLLDPARQQVTQRLAAARCLPSLLRRARRPLLVVMRSRRRNRRSRG